MTIEVDAPALELAPAAVPVAAPGLLLVLLPLEHAAARTATAATPPTPVASLAAGDIRFTMELVICLSPV
jgi:hypothetical protein